MLSSVFSSSELMLGEPRAWTEEWSFRLQQSQTEKEEKDIYFCSFDFYPLGRKVRQSRPPPIVPSSPPPPFCQNTPPETVRICQY